MLVSEHNRYAMIETGLVSTHWLADRLDNPSLRLVDGSWYLPTSGRDARSEYLASHLPGAVFFDLDAVSDRDSSLPHMLPPLGSSPSRSERWVSVIGTT